GKAVGLGGEVSACAELLHAVAGARSPAARHLHWLANAQNTWWPGGRWSVHSAGDHLHHGAQLCLRALWTTARGHSLVLRITGRGSGNRDRGCHPNWQACTEKPLSYGSRRRCVCWHFLLRSSVPVDHLCCCTPWVCWRRSYRSAGTSV